MNRKSEAEQPDAEAQRQTSEPSPQPSAEPTAGADTSPDEDAQEPEDELTRLKRERDQFEERWQRVHADLENFRRRQRKDVAESRQRAIEGLAAELLPVLDNFHLALGVQTADGANTDPSMVVEGLKMVRSMLEGTLERHGLSEIPSEGKSFDPNIHEAVGIDSESDRDAGTVTKVMQRGYRIGEKVLRASRVIVSGEAPDDEPATGNGN